MSVVVMGNVAQSCILFIILVIGLFVKQAKVVESINL
jgi:hypothetical protein